MVNNIAELSELSRRLNKKSDTLSTTIISLNEKLAKLNLGVETWLTSSPIERGDPYYDYETDEHGNFPLHDETWLGYRRFDELGWVLAIKLVALQPDRDSGEEKIVEAEAKPLLDASREIRLKVMKLVPGLLDAVKQKAEELLESIDKAEKAAQTLTGETFNLGLRKVASFRTGLVPSPNDTTYQYAVENLPKGQEAFIANFGRGNHPNWRILRIINQVQGTWSGKYETATHALAALQHEVELESTLD
jgi:hypothetical protein